jgi:hypothetical protein
MDFIKWAAKLLGTVWAIWWWIFWLNQATKGAILEDDYDKMDKEMLAKEEEDKAQFDYYKFKVDTWVASDEEKTQYDYLTLNKPASFLKEYDTKEDLVNNSWPNRDVNAENEIGADLKTKASNIDAKLNWFWQKAQDNAQDDIEKWRIATEQARAKQLRDWIAQKAFDINLSQPVRDKYAALLRFTDETLTSREGGLYQSYQAKNANPLKNANDNIEKMYSAHSTTFEKLNPEDLKDQKKVDDATDLMDDELSQTLNDNEVKSQLDLQVAEGKYKDLDKVENPITKTLLKFYYGIPLWRQQATTEMKNLDVDKAIGETNPIGIAAAWVADIVWWELKAIWGNVTEGKWNPWLYIGNVLWFIPAAFSYLAGEWKELTRDSFDVAKANSYVAKLQNKRLEAEYEKDPSGHSVVWLYAKKLWNYLAGNPEGLAEFVGSMISGAWEMRLLGSLWKIGKVWEVISDINKSKAGRVFLKAGTEMLEGMNMNAYFNTMAGQQWSAKNAAMDVTLDWLVWVIGWIWGEHKAAKFINNEIGNLEKTFNTALEATNGDALQALKDIKLDYDAKFPSHIIDNVIAEAEKNPNKLPKIADLMENTKMDFLTRQWGDAVKSYEYIARAKQIDTLNGIGTLDQQKDAMKKWFGLNIDMYKEAASTADAKNVESILGKTDNAFKDMYYSLKQNQPNIIRDIENAKSTIELQNILWKDMWGKAMADFQMMKYTTKGINQTLNKLYEGIRSDDKEQVKQSVAWLQMYMKQIGAIDASIADLTSQYGKKSQNEALQLVSDNAKAQIRDAVEKIQTAKKNTQEIKWLQAQLEWLQEKPSTIEEAIKPEVMPEQVAEQPAEDLASLDAVMRAETDFKASLNKKEFLAKQQDAFFEKVQTHVENMDVENLSKELDARFEITDSNQLAKAIIEWDTVWAQNIIANSVPQDLMDAIVSSEKSKLPVEMQKNLVKFDSMVETLWKTMAMWSDSLKVWADKLEAVASSYSQDIYNKIAWKSQWLDISSFMDNDEINSLLNKYGDFIEGSISDMVQSSSKQRIFLYGHNAIGWIVNPGVESAANVFDSHKKFLTELNNVKLYKNGEEVTKLDDKLAIFSSNDFNRTTLEWAGYKLGANQSLDTINSSLTNIINKYDGNQKNFLKEFMLLNGGKKFSDQEWHTMKQLFNVTDSYRLQYNQHLIDKCIQWEALNLQEISALTKLGSWMWDGENKLWVLFSGFGITKKYLYEWNKTAFWTGFKRAIDEFGKTDVKYLKDINIKWNELNGKFLDGQDFPKVMDDMYQKILSDMEVNHFAQYKSKIADMWDTELRAEINTNFSSYKDELDWLMKDGWPDAVKTKIDSILEETKKDAASRFLYNPFEHFVQNGNDEMVVNKLLGNFFDYNEKYPNLGKSLDIGDRDVNIKYFTDNVLESEQKQIVEEYLNKKFYDDLVSKAEVDGNYMMPIENADGLKQKLADMFTYSNSKAAKEARDTISEGAGTNEQMASIISKKQLDNTYQHYISTQQSFAEAVIGQEADDVNTLNKVAGNIYGDLLSKWDNKTADIIFKEWLAWLSDTEYKAARLQMADMYGQIVQTETDNLKELSNLYKSKYNVSKKSYDQNPFFKQVDDYLTKIFNNIAPDISDSKIAKTMYGDMISKYDAWKGTFNFSVDDWAKFGGWFTRTFYPINRALSKSEEWSRLSKLVQELHNSAKFWTKMTLDYNFVNALKKVGVWEIEWNILKIWDTAIEIGQTVSADMMSRIYKDMLFNTKNKNWLGKKVFQKAFNTADMQTISSRVKALYDAEKAGNKFIPSYNVENRLDFASEFIYSYWKNYFGGMEKNFGYRKILGVNKQTGNWAEYVWENMMKPFFEGLNGNKNALRYGADILWPTTPADLVYKMQTEIEKIGFATDGKQAVDAIMYKSYVNYSDLMQTWQGMRSMMYSFLFNIAQFPKLWQQFATNFLKEKGMNAVIWWVEDFKGSYLDMMTKTYGIDEWSFNKMSDNIDSNIQEFETKLGKYTRMWISTIFNAMPLADKAIAKNVKVNAIVGAAQTLWFTPESFKHYGDVLAWIWKTLDVVDITKLTELGKDMEAGYDFLGNIKKAFDNNSSINPKDVKMLDDFIESKAKQLNQPEIDMLLDMSSKLKSEYNDIIHVNRTIKTLADGYTASFFHAGTRELTANVAATREWSQLVLPLYNWATKEFATNVGDLSMDFARVTSRYGSFGQMMKSKAFYGELMSMPSVINLAAQTIQFSLYFKNIQKVMQAKWNSEYSDLDFWNTMIAMMWPLASAQQIMQPLTNWLKKAQAFKEMGASNTSAIWEWVKQAQSDISAWFLKDAGMYADMIMEWASTMWELNKKWLSYDTLTNVVFPLLLKKATSSVVMGTMNSYRGYQLDSKWYDLASAVNLVWYGTFTKWAIDEKKAQELFFWTKEYNWAKKSLADQLAGKQGWLPNVGIITDVWNQNMQDKGVMTLQFGDEWYQEQLDAITSAPDNEWKLADVVIKTLKWEGDSSSKGLKQMSAEEVRKEEQSLLDQVTEKWHLDLLSNAEQIKENVLTYRGRFSASYAFWVILEAKAKKYADDATAWDKKAVQAQLKWVFGKSMYSKSLDKKDIDTQKQVLRDQFIKWYYKDAVTFNKQVGIATILKASELQWADMTAGAEGAAVALELFDKAIRGKEGWNYVDWMSKVKNFYSMAFKTYEKDIGKMMETNPDAFLNWFSSTTNLIDSSDRASIAKAYTKWGMLYALWDKVSDIFDKSPEIARKYKDVGAMIAWDMLENSNRLTKEWAIREVLWEGWKAKGAGIKVAANKIKENALKVFDAINPKYSFSWWKWTNGWADRIPGLNMKVRDYNIEWLTVKSLTTKPLTTNDLTSKDVTPGRGKVTATKITGISKPKWVKSFQRTVRW